MGLRGGAAGEQVLDPRQRRALLRAADERPGEQAHHSVVEAIPREAQCDERAAAVDRDVVDRANGVPLGLAAMHGETGKVVRAKKEFCSFAKDAEVEDATNKPSLADLKGMEKGLIPHAVSVGLPAGMVLGMKIGAVGVARRTRISRGSVALSAYCHWPPRNRPLSSLRPLRSKRKGPPRQRVAEHALDRGIARMLLPRKGGGPPDLPPGLGDWVRRNHIESLVSTSPPRAQLCKACPRQSNSPLSRAHPRPHIATART